MKGDRVEIVVDAGGGLRTYEVVEVTRGGTTVRSARFMASRVVALVEHPVTSPPLADDSRD